MSSITRFAVKSVNNKYYGIHHLTENIWEAKLYSDKPSVVVGQEVVMISISYEEIPYKVTGEYE